MPETEEPAACGLAFWASAAAVVAEEPGVGSRHSNTGTSAVARECASTPICVDVRVTEWLRGRAACVTLHPHLLSDEHVHFSSAQIKAGATSALAPVLLLQGSEH
eukprot:1144778-Pelagomonas_calceolata.AAC.4